jgi:predicted NUDIX family phosphoesterase
MPRHEAERSSEWVQIIPVAVVCRTDGRICVLRRIKETRADLKSRLTIVVGGHVDQPKEIGHSSWTDIIREALKRELDEELGLEDVSISEPLGFVLDPASRSSSKHVAIVHMVKADQEISARATEEFSTRSKYSGTFKSPSELAKLRKQLDPWSLLILEDFLGPSVGLNLPKQGRLPISVDS